MLAFRSWRGVSHEYGEAPGFPESFKREAVEWVDTSGLSAGAVAIELGLHETVLRRWMMQFGPSDLVAENTRSKRENDRLRMEHDILKKPRSSSERSCPEERFCTPSLFRPSSV